MLWRKKRGWALRTIGGVVNWENMRLVEYLQSGKWDYTQLNNQCSDAWIHLILTNGSLTLYNCWQSREVKCQSPVEAKISTNSCKDGGFCFPVHDNALRGSCQSCHQQRIELSLKKHKTGIKCLFERSCRPFASISAAARRSWSHRSKFLQMSRKFGCSEYISWLPS